MGTEVAADAILFRQFTKQENEKLATTWARAARSPATASGWTLIYFTGTRSNDLWVADFTQFLSTGKLEKREVTIGKDGNSFGFVDGETLFVQTNVGAPNGGRRPRPAVDRRRRPRSAAHAAASALECRSRASASPRGCWRSST